MRHRAEGLVASTILFVAVDACNTSPSTLAEGTASVSAQGSATPPGPATVASSAAPSASTAAKSPPGPVDPAMVRLPAGTYLQGSAGATGDDFAWQHMESVPSFDLDVTEVTVEAYQTCLDAGACTYAPRDTNCNLERERDEYKRDPVNCVTWAEAVKYCAWRGAELPTDGMWEYAAGGRRDQQYPWDPKWPLRRDRGKNPFRIIYIAVYGGCREGETELDITLPQRANYGRNTTCPVGSLPHGDTLEGVKDMAGNVSEWTQTPYCRHHKKLCDDGFRTVKGDAFNAFGDPGRHYRFSIDETTSPPAIGFRCARVVNKDPTKGR
jgi:formylglycine-generating enzyme required for sulfatase activity